MNQAVTPNNLVDKRIMAATRMPIARNTVLRRLRVFIQCWSIDWQDGVKVVTRVDFFYGLHRKLAKVL
jgi:hypothetical protein